MLPLLLAFTVAAEPPAHPRPDSPPTSTPAATLATLRVADLVEGTGATLGPSARARALAGRHVRLLGYMARLEEPVAGSFWLAAGPVECDEGGAGTGDLPPGSVLVLAGADGGLPEEHLAGPIAVTGLLRVGQDSSADGQVSAFQLLLDPGQPATPASSTPQPGFTPKGAPHALHR